MEIVGKKFKLVVEQDEFADSPRVWDNLGEMICWHGRYDLGDKHRYSDPRDFLEDLAGRYVTPIDIIHYVSETYASIEANLDENRLDIDEGNFDEWEDEELFKVVRENCTILPLYLYDHSGITISTSPFSCRWDSGQVGWIYCENKVGLPIEGSIEEIKKRLLAEVEVYDQYLTGEVYGFFLYEKEVIRHKIQEMDENWDEIGEPELKTIETWEEYDSCLGFYGDDWKTNGILDLLPQEAVEDLMGGK